jgi:hypothetical protein
MADLIFLAVGVVLVLIGRRVANKHDLDVETKEIE